MQYCELDDYAMPAGEVVIWRPRAQLDAARPDTRPLAPQHERHMLRHGPDASSDWIGMAFEIHARYEPEAMRRALWLWHRRHESLRSAAARGPRGFQRMLLPPEAVEFAADSAGEFASGREVSRQIEAILAHTLSPHRWPSLVTTVVLPRQLAFEPPRFLVVFGADHAVVDAYSLVMAVSELEGLYATALSGRDPEDEPREVPSYVDFSALERELLAQPEDRPTLGRWRAFLAAEEGFGFPGFPGPTDAAPTDRQRSFYGPLLRSGETAAVHRGAKVRGHGMKTAVLAALAKATAETTASPELRFVMPMHTRTPDYEHAMGWFVGLSPVTIDCRTAPDGRTGADGFLHRAAEAIRHAREDATVPFPVIEEHLGIEANPRFVISYLDLRFVPGAERFDVVRACALRRPVSSPGEVYLWITRALSGLNVSARLSDDPLLIATFERFLATTREALLDLAAIDAADDSEMLAA